MYSTGNIVIFVWSVFYKNIKLLSCTPETNIILYINYTSIKNKEENKIHLL